MRGIVAATGLVLVLAACGSYAGTAQSPSGTSPSSGRGGPRPAGPAAQTSPRSITTRDVGRVLTQVPVPAGASRATAAEASEITVVSSDSSPDLVDLHTTYVVPASMDEVITWYGAHPPPHSTPSGSSSGTDSGHVTRGLTWDLRHGRTTAYGDMEVQVASTDVGTGRALLRIDVQAVWLPADSTWIDVPVTARSVDVVHVSDSGVVRRATWTGRPVRELAALIDSQHVAENGTYNCPDDRGGHDVLTFHGPWPERSYHVQAEGCEFITATVGGSRLSAALFGGGQVDRLVTRLLRTAGR